MRTLALCSMLYALCSMLYALCSMLYALKHNTAPTNNSQPPQRQDAAPRTTASHAFAVTSDNRELLAAKAASFQVRSLSR